MVVYIGNSTNMALTWELELFIDYPDSGKVTRRLTTTATGASSVSGRALLSRTVSGEDALEVSRVNTYGFLGETMGTYYPRMIFPNSILRTSKQNPSRLLVFHSKRRLPAQNPSLQILRGSPDGELSRLGSLLGTLHKGWTLCALGSFV